MVPRIIVGMGSPVHNSEVFYVSAYICNMYNVNMYICNMHVLNINYKSWTVILCTLEFITYLFILAYVLEYPFSQLFMPNITDYFMVKTWILNYKVAHKLYKLNWRRSFYKTHFGNTVHYKMNKTIIRYCSRKPRGLEEWETYLHNKWIYLILEETMFELNLKE